MRECAFVVVVVSVEARREEVGVWREGVVGRGDVIVDIELVGQREGW